MNNIKNILFIVCISFFSMVLTAEKPEVGDDSLSESGVFESGWQNHLNALLQDKYWKKDLLALKGQKKDLLALKEQWINSAVEAAMNEKKPLDDLVKDLENKLIAVVGDKFKDQITTIGRRDMLVDPIVNYFAEKFKERETKRTSANKEFLQSLKKIKTDSSGNFDLEWKKNIFMQIKDLIQLGLEEDYITNQIIQAIQDYNAGLSYWYFSYKISDKKKEDIVNDIKNMKTMRDFQLQQLSTSGLEQLIQADVTKEQKNEDEKVKKYFRHLLNVVTEKGSKMFAAVAIKKAPEHIIETAKDLIDIYKNPQIVVDTINKEFDRKEESLNKNAGFFTSNSEKIEEINQIKTNIINNIMDYLRNYEKLSGIRKEVKMLQQQKRKESQKVEEFRQNLQNEQQAQLLIQKEIQKEDLSSGVQKIAQKIGKQKSFLTEEQQKQWEIKNKKWKEEENDAMIRIKKRLEKKEGHTGLEAEVFKKELSEEERQQRWERVPKQKTRLKRFFEYQRLKKEKPLQQNILPQQNILLMKQIEYK